MSSSVLIVEDEAIIAEDLRQSLECLGYTIFGVVASGEAAIEAVKDRAPDLVLIDIRLRGQMDGIDTARELRCRASLPIIYLTSHADEATLTRAKSTAPHGYLLKPFSDRDLRTAIEVAASKHLLERRLAERERWFATILQSIGNAVITTDLEGRITFMNAAAEQLTNVLSSQVVGTPFAMPLGVLEGELGCAGDADDPLPRAMRERRVIDVCWGGTVAGSGVASTFEGTVAPLLDADRGLLGAVIAFRDTSAQRQRDSAKMAKAGDDEIPPSSVQELGGTVASSGSRR